MQMVATQSMLTRFPDEAAGPAARPNTSRLTLGALEALGRRPDSHNPQVIQEAASQFVSELFFAPLLAEMRRFPLGRELATGGRTEAAFGQLLDQRIADRVAATGRGLVKQIVRRLEKSVDPAAVGAERACWPAQLQLRPTAAGSHL